MVFSNTYRLEDLSVDSAISDGVDVRQTVAKGMHVT